MTTRNPAHPPVHDPNDRRPWQQWLPRPAAPTTKAGLRKLASDHAVFSVETRDRVAANAAGKSLAQYRADRHRGALQQQMTDAVTETARLATARLRDARRRRRW
jgi:hypothetical protein